MSQYPKIHTLWKRDPDTKKIIEGEFSKPEFESINRWLVTEKIDGMNIRIYYEFPIPVKIDRDIYWIGSVTFKGRTDKAIIPGHLMTYLTEKFTPEKMYETFVKDKENVDNMDVVLYGEGYGPKIQNGHLYRDDVSFALFDVKVGHWWLDREDVEKIAEELETPVATVIYGGASMYDLDACQDLIKEYYDRDLSFINPKAFEGIVARAYPMMLFRDGTPIMFKLKVKDYE